MKHKFLFVVSIIPVLALVISSVSFTITKTQLETAQDEYISIKEKNKEIITDVDSEILRLKNQRNRADADYERASSAQGVSKTAADYYHSRYEFNGSPQDNKSRIINEIRDYTTKQFRDDLEIELAKSGGNGHVSEDFRHSCSIKSLFVSEIYKKSNKNLGKKSEIYLLDVYARLWLNDSYDAVSVLTFTLKSEKWKIADERIVATRFEEY